MLHFAVVKNSNVRYVNDIFAGFTSALERVKDIGYLAHHETEFGIPEASSGDRNAQIIESLLAKFPADGDVYIVTIGTEVSEAAHRAYSKTHKILFLGVTDPVRSGLHTPDRAQDNVAGVRYGAALDRTIATILRAFPGKRLAFIHNGKRYRQDTYIVEEIQQLNAQRGTDVQTLDVPTFTLDAEALAASDLFFGRYYLCSNIAAFVAHNKQTAFIGTSRVNVEAGAVMSVGYDTVALGALAVTEILLPSVSQVRSLGSFGMLEPQKLSIFAGTRKILKCNLTLSPDIIDEVELLG